jgi:pyruvate,orthophosphate dikinase
MDRLAEELLQMLLVKGTAPSEALPPAIGSEPGAVDRALGSLVAAGLVDDTRAWGLRLTAAGRDRAQQLFAADGDRIGKPGALAALEQFAGLDVPLKRIITDWQLRADLGAGAANDHSDPRYDERVLRRLAAHHEQACRWLERFAAGLPRAALYRQRLERAHASIGSGDLRFIASPRVDSYHTIWFELHEDLLRVAGRTRAEESGSERAG